MGDIIIKLIQFTTFFHNLQVASENIAESTDMGFPIAILIIMW